MTTNTDNWRSSDDVRAALMETIQKIPSTKDFEETAERFAAYPEPTLIGPAARAFLHELVKVCGAKAVLEIGTYFGGTTRALAEAAGEVGGVLITIDASGDREATVKKIIALWPDELQALTTFVPHLSSMFFEMFERTGSFKFDVLFVDGDHSYRGALFDLVSCAHYAQPNAVIVVDDFNLPPVFAATRDFLVLNPAWRELSGAFDSGIAGDPFGGMRASLDGLPFLVLTGPSAISIGRRPTNFDLGPLDQAPIRGAVVRTSGDHGAGRLYANFLISSITSEAMRSSSANTFVEIAEEGGVAEIRLDPPLAPSLSDGAANSCALSLVWETPEGRLLELAGEPELLS